MRPAIVTYYRAFWKKPETLMIISNIASVGPHVPVFHVTYLTADLGFHLFKVGWVEAGDS